LTITHLYPPCFFHCAASTPPLHSFPTRRSSDLIINFAPLWRLVPHHKPWQKELKATWEALCAGRYDWAHLAMHLWPERVVAKCADRKSTRLNSSHSQISYAVFCLKKKKNTNTIS